uniref:Uncharacterized protein n=1 Tax=Mycobacterium riyadhense TaxID=486698 RepID=A0A653EV68_9MYCO|nr:hypothetical protein BIN_B_03623 [Mycobacterium riyadhense]
MSAALAVVLLVGPTGLVGWACDRDEVFGDPRIGNSPTQSERRSAFDQQQRITAVVSEHGCELCDDDHRDVSLRSTEHDTLPFCCLGETISE